MTGAPTANKLFLPTELFLGYELFPPLSITLLRTDGPVHKYNRNAAIFLYFIFGFILL